MEFEWNLRFLVHPCPKFSTKSGLIATSYKMFEATQCESSGLIPNWAKVYEDGRLGEGLWTFRKDGMSEEPAGTIFRGDFNQKTWDLGF